MNGSTPSVAKNSGVTRPRFSIDVAPVSPTTEVARLMAASEDKAGISPRRSSSVVRDAPLLPFASFG